MKNALKKTLKFFKWAGLTFAGLVSLCVFLPWVAITLFGTILGSFFASFMTGFSRGTAFTHKVAVGMAYLRSAAEAKKIDRKSKALIDAYPGGFDKLLADYNSTLTKLRTDFVFKHFGADHTVQIEMYLKDKLENTK